MRLAPRLWLALAASAALTAACGKSSSKGSDAPAPSGDDRSAEHPVTPPPSTQPAHPGPTTPGGGGGGGGTATTTPPPAAFPAERQAACKAAWDAHGNLYKVGLEKVYKKTIKTTRGTQAPTTLVMEIKETVTKVTAEGWTVDRVTHTLEPKELPPIKTTPTTTKNSFMDDCLHGLVSAGDDDATVEKVGTDSNEKLTVAAGTFDTVHSKSKTTGVDKDRSEDTPYTIDDETWMLAGPAASLGIYVKVVDVLKEADVVTEQTAELTELKLP